MGRLAVALIFLLICPVMSFVHEVRCIDISGPTFIRADGSIDPSTAPISTFDNITYTLTCDTKDSIVIERDNIVVDGALYIVEGTGSGYGITLSGRTNVTIKKMTIKAFGLVFWLDSSSNNTISGNNITDNGGGIRLGNSAGNTISGNDITNNVRGMRWTLLLTTRYLTITSRQTRTLAFGFILLQTTIVSLETT